MELLCKYPCAEDTERLFFQRVTGGRGVGGEDCPEQLQRKVQMSRVALTPGNAGWGVR